MLEHFCEDLTNNLVGLLAAILLTVLGGVLAFNCFDTPDVQPIVYLTNPIELNADTFGPDDEYILTFTRCNNSDETLFGTFASTIRNGGVPYTLAEGTLNSNKLDDEGNPVLDTEGNIIRIPGVIPGCQPFVTQGHTVPEEIPAALGYHIETAISYRADSNAPGCSSASGEETPSSICVLSVPTQLFEVVD